MLKCKYHHVDLNEGIGQDFEIPVPEEVDVVFVPPFMPHVEANMSLDEDLVWMTCRTPDNIVVNLEDVPDQMLEGYRR